MALAENQTAPRIIVSAAPNFIPTMALQIVPYEPHHTAAVAAFNRRAEASGAPFGLSKTARPEWLPWMEGCALYRQYFLALDGAEVRGGFILRQQPFWLNGVVRSAANYQGPLSEGLWDRRYMMAGVQILRTALREQPFLYALGMGGLAQPFPKLLASAGWTLRPVPFLFKVLRPARFLRHIRPLHRTRMRALMADLAAWSGLGFLAIHSAQWWQRQRRPDTACHAGVVTEFGPWADRIWEQARAEYRFCAVRDRAVQNTLFGDGNAKNIVLHCRRAGASVGWAVVRSTQMRGDQYFGDLRVGSLVDALAVPGEEFVVVQLAVAHLQNLGSDLVVTNQSHRLWVAALQANGFFNGPSNFIFACSPALAAELGDADQFLGAIHFNRADGDGPIHL